MIRGYCHAFYLEVPWIMPLIFPQFLSCLPWNSHQEEWSWGNICIFLISLFHRSKEIKIYSSLILAYIANVSLIWYIHLFCLNQVKHKKHQIIFIAINKHNHRYELQYSWYFETCSIFILNSTWSLWSDFNQCCFFISSALCQSRISKADKESMTHSISINCLL